MLTSMASFGKVLDAVDPEPLAGFGSGALGYQRLGEAGNYVLLVSTDPGSPSCSSRGCRTQGRQEPPPTTSSSTRCHRLLHTVPRLIEIVLHANPGGCPDAHERLRHHDRHAAA